MELQGTQALINKIIIVPDVHGRTFWRSLLEDKSNLPIVFLGDYLDPYTYEGIYPSQAIEEFKKIIEFKKLNPERVTLLLGNHDLHYLNLAEDDCRLDQRDLDEIFNLYNDNRGLFQLCKKYDNVLLSHAGVTNGWLKQNEFEGISSSNVEDYLNNLLEICTWSKPIISFSGVRGYIHTPLSDIGASRGGYLQWGGPTWADADEMWKDAAFSGELIQIVGHSQLERNGSFLHNGNFYCCDSREIFIWDGNNLKNYEKDLVE